jgi:hypothetical protein
MSSNPVLRVTACGQRGRYFVDRQPERLAQNYPNLEKNAFLAPIGKSFAFVVGNAPTTTVVTIGTEGVDAASRQMYFSNSWPRHFGTPRHQPLPDGQGTTAIRFVSESAQIMRR